MRSMKYLTLFAALLMLLSLGAFAKDTNDGKFDLTEQARVGSTVLPPGHYKAEWTGSADNLQVSILQRGKTVATVQGHLKEMPEAAPYDSVTFRTLHDQSKLVEEIDFNNRKDALVLSRASS